MATNSSRGRDRSCWRASWWWHYVAIGISPRRGRHLKLKGCRASRGFQVESWWAFPEFRIDFEGVILWVFFFLEGECIHFCDCWLLIVRTAIREWRWLVLLDLFLWLSFGNAFDWNWLFETITNHQIDSYDVGTSPMVCFWKGNVFQAMSGVQMSSEPSLVYYRFAHSCPPKAAWRPCFPAKDDARKRLKII